MSDEGEKTCPLCAEEMDLTDQQLKPCKCGYEICVWCWHHIMEMAEKDATEGRCPACRASYDKERIVRTAANCERLVVEVNMERKLKSQKAKIKTSESRKHLSSVRVIQRNLVYIVGLPLNVADEDLLQRKEYFGQYGNILKVSVSRTSAGSIQQFANNTCSVYITYLKEEEAVRCIQSVHGFMLDGRPLRACFGTSKYCHAWLRNVPCNSPDCLYLHEIASHEDSFAKDEIISASTRAQQSTGCTNNMQRRSGVALPPATDDYCNNNSPVIGKAVAKSSSNVPALSFKCLPPSICSSRSDVPPLAASWESRAADPTPAGSVACSNGLVKHKADVNGLPKISTVVSDSTEGSMLPNYDGQKCLSDNSRAVQTKNKLEVLQTEQHGVHSDAKGPEVSAALSSALAVKLGNHSPCPPAAKNGNAESGLLLDTALCVGPSSGLNKGRIPFAEEKFQNLCSEMLRMGVDQRAKEHSDIIGQNSLCLDAYQLPAGQGLQWHDSEKLHDDSMSATAITASGTVDSMNTSTGVCDWKSNAQDHEVLKLTYQTEGDFDNQRLTDAILVNQATMSTSLHLLGHLRAPLQEHTDAAGVADYNVNSATATRKPNEGFGTNVPGASAGYNFDSCTSGQGLSGSQFNIGQGNRIGRFDYGLPNLDLQSVIDLGESCLISNILDLDSWDDSLTSPQNLAKFLGKSDESEVPMKLSNSWKGQISNQSRFSFARQEESRYHLFDFESSLNNIVQGDENRPFGQSFIENRGPYLDIVGNGFGFSQCTEKSDNLTSNHSALPSSKLALTRSQISAPPGFSVRSRSPPPGFCSHERIDQAFDLKSGKHLLETSSLLRNPYQALPGGNINAASDIELMDPAILSVGKGRLPIGVNGTGVDMRQNFHVQASLFENDSRPQLLMQRYLSHRQGLRCTEVRDNFSAVVDAYGFTSRQHMEESQRSNLWPFMPFSLQQARNTVATNGHWNGWSEIQTGNDLGVAELLRNDRLGFNKFGMTSSGDLYDRSFMM